MLDNMKVIIKNKKGFSFMEVMVSVFVLSIGITAIVALMAGNIKNSIESRDSIIASELAQEGDEIVRNIRDNNFLANPTTPFLNLNNGTYRVSYDAGIENGSYQLNYNNGFYTYSGGAATKFYRKIDIADYGGTIGKDVKSTVWWGGSNVPASCNASTKCIYIEDILTDWAN